MRSRLRAAVLLAAAILPVPLPAQEPKREPPKFDPAELFKKADTNGDGKLSKDEFIKLTSAFPKAKAGPEMPAKWLAHYDADKDGAISLDEFRTFVTPTAKKGEPKRGEPKKDPPKVDPAPGKTPTTDQLAFFEKNIRPVLVGKCAECHSAEKNKVKGGLARDSVAGLFERGDSGPAVVPGKPADRAAAEHGGVGAVRPRHRERQPAGVRHHLPAHGQRRAAELRQRVPAGRPAGHANRHQPHAGRQRPHRQPKNPIRTTADQEAQLDSLRTLDSAAQKTDPGNPFLDGLMASHELAYRMQGELPPVIDLTRESAATKTLYGIGDKATDDFGRQCLMARRLLEAGVRFVEVCHGGWGQHRNLKDDHARHALAVDRPIAGLLADLEAKGLLKDTLVIRAGEFGRTPYAQGGDGRDHNHLGFTTWFAGGGAKAGFAHGSTDDFGLESVVNPVHIHDWHATILHLLGLDHEKLTHRHAGRDRRLTDVKGNVVTDILA